MPSKDETASCLHIPDLHVQGQLPARIQENLTQPTHLDRSIRTPTGQRIPIIMQTHDILGMPLEYPQTLSRPPIPHAQRLVRTPRDEHGLIKLQRPDRPRMPKERPYDLAGIQVPDFDRLVVRTRDQDGVRRGGQVVLDLKTHDPVGMSLEDTFNRTTFSPISFDHETFAVDVFPWFPTGRSSG
jgi:hypothetical protein